MYDNSNVIGWFTVKGQHIPIMNGESKQDAYNRRIGDKYYTEYDALLHLSDDSNKWWNELDSEEHKAIYRYTGGLDKDINPYLANGELIIGRHDAIEKQVKNNIEILDKALSKYTLSDNVVTYKGCTAERILGKDYNKDMTTKELKDKFLNKKDIIKEYCSTSTHKEVAEKFKKDCVVTFHAFKGSKGVPLFEHSSYPTEHEVLFARNQNYVIIDIENKNGIIYIDAGIIG